MIIMRFDYFYEDIILIEVFKILIHGKLFIGGSVAQVVRRLPPTAGVPSSRLGHSMWVSW